MEVLHLGLIEYAAAMERQADLAARVQAGQADCVILVLRHPPTITLGRRTEDREVHVSPDQARARGVALHRTDRGGGATFHYPGQAVVYPVLRLGRFRLSVGGLIELLGASVVELLQGYQIAAEWDPSRPGAYVDGAKIASIGLHISRDVSTHGVAVNVGPDTSGFDLIDPCKMPGLRVTSMSEVLGPGTGIAGKPAPGTLDPDLVGSDLAGIIARRLQARQ